MLMVLGANAFALNIEECYRLAKENYPLIRQYDLTKQMSKYSYQNAALATWVPQVSLSASATLQSAVTEFPSAFNAIWEAAGINLKGLTNDQYNFQLQIYQTIWDGGYAKAQREAVLADEEVSLLTLDTEVDAILTQINQMYFGVLLMEANLRTNIAADELMSENLKVAEAAIESGAAMQSDADNIKVEILSLRQQRRQIEMSIKTYRLMLAIMIGREITDAETFEKPTALLVDTSFNNRKELQLFDAQIRQVESSRKMLNAAITPKFAFTAQGWYGKPGLNLFEDMMNGKFSWNGILGVSMQWNLNGFYTRKNDKRKLDLSIKSIEAQRDVFNWNISLQQTQIESEIQRMREIKESDNEIVTLRESVRKASESKFRNGVITSSDLLRDITNENNAVISRESHELELLRDIYDMKITLNQIDNE